MIGKLLLYILHKQFDFPNKDSLQKSGDGSDEPHNCTYVQCTANQFKCDNLRCISKTLKCNKRNDCFDNSDEKPELCRNSTCSPAEFKCRNGSCISNNLVCNQRNGLVLISCFKN